jgi:hypothetical protein
MSVQQDPFAAAVSDAESASHYFGKMGVDAQFVVLRKGQPKSIWQENESTEGRTTEIIMRLDPIDAMNMTRAVERNMLSNSTEWSKIVWSVLKGMGYSTPKEIDGLWAHVELVPSGRKWNNKEGQEVIGTTFRFIKVFRTQAECEIAYTAFSGNEAHSTAAQAATTRPPVSQNTDANRLAALQFLSHVVLQHRDNAVALDAALKSTPLVKDFFTINSPEVLEILTPFGS